MAALAGSLGRDIASEITALLPGRTPLLERARVQLLSLPARGVVVTERLRGWIRPVELGERAGCLPHSNQKGALPVWSRPRIYGWMFFLNHWLRLMG